MFVFVSFSREDRCRKVGVMYWDEVRFFCCLLNTVYGTADLHFIQTPQRLQIHV